MVAVLSGAALMACDPSEFIELELGVGDGASEGVKESALVDGTKAARIELSTGASVSFEKGAVVNPIDIGVERPSDQESLPFVKALPQPLAINSAPYVLTPHGTEFKGKVTLELPVANDKGRPQVVAYLENEEDRNWKLLGAAEVSEGKAKIDLKHFSVVILLDAADAKLGTSTSTGSSGSKSDAGISSGGVARADAGTSAPIALPGDAGFIDFPVDPAKFDAGDWQGYFDTGVPNGGIGEGGAPAEYDAATPTPPDAAVYMPPDAAVKNVFIDNGDGTVTDATLSIQWEQAVVQQQSAWDVGASYCAGLTLGGGGGWRLPTLAELKTLVNTQYQPRIDPKFFPNTPAERFWSANPNGGTQHWYVDFQSGYENAGSISTVRTRCVRTTVLK